MIIMIIIVICTSAAIYIIIVRLLIADVDVHDISHSVGALLSHSDTRPSNEFILFDHMTISRSDYTRRGGMLDLVDNAGL